MKTNNSNKITMGEVLQNVPANYKPEAMALALQQEDRNSYPVIIRILMVIGAWIGAVSLSSFVIFFLLKNNEAGMIGFGTVLIVTGLGLSYIRVWRVAFDAFGLALTVIGIAVLMAGLDYDLDRSNLHNLYIAGIELFIAIFTRSRVQRTVGVFGFFSFLALYFFFNLHSPEAIMTEFGICAALIVLLHLAESWFMQHARKLMAVYQPVLGGLVLSFAALSLFFLIRHPEFDGPFDNTEHTFSGWWPAAIPAALALLILVYRILRNPGNLVPARIGVILLLALLCLAPMIKAPGIIAGLLLICCGFHTGQKITLGLGMLLLVFHCIMFYYLMETTLLTKSLLMMASGVLLVTGAIVFNFIRNRS